MAHISEILPIVVDPNHERFGQIGEMTASDREFGNCLIRFEDGKDTFLNGGWITGIPQFVAPLKNHEAGVHRLRDALPDMQPALLSFAEQVVDAHRQPPTEETVAARAGFVALIKGIIFEPGQA